MAIDWEECPLSDNFFICLPFDGLAKRDLCFCFLPRALVFDSNEHIPPASLGFVDLWILGGCGCR